MTLPREYESRTCEVDDCDHPRGASLRSIKSYGCILCAWHEELYQKGEIDLPNTASRDRKRKAENIIYAK